MKGITALAIALAVIILSVKFTLNFKPLYYFDVDHLEITADTDLSRDEIVSAYDYLIYYIDSSRDMDFKIPNLPSSPQGAIHFKEVRAIFKNLDIILYASAAVAALGIYRLRKKREF